MEFVHDAFGLETFETHPLAPFVSHKQWEEERPGAVQKARAADSAEAKTKNEKSGAAPERPARAPPADEKTELWVDAIGKILARHHNEHSGAPLPLELIGQAPEYA